MKIMDSIKYTGLAALVLSVAVGCAAVQEPGPAADGQQQQARQAIQDARDASAAAAKEGQVWRDTDKFIDDAEKALEAGDAGKALQLARRAQAEAEMAAQQRRTERQTFSRAQAEGAIKGAEEALREAQQAGQAWRDTEKTLDEARKAFAAEDYDRATELANKARSEAMMALQQRRTEGQQFRSAQGEQATQYTVRRGDSLWTISGKAEVYGNPYHWPLIYRTNRDQIRDADLIFPGQQFRIDRNVSRPDAEAAVRHARTRGEWEIGRVEQSDQNYLRGR